MHDGLFRPCVGLGLNSILSRVRVVELHTPSLMTRFYHATSDIERKPLLNLVHPAITTTLQAQHASFVALANKAAALDAEMEKLKATYRQLWRARTGSARDPFNEVDRGTIGGGEVGLEGLSVH